MQDSKLLNERAGNWHKLMQFSAWQWVVLLGSVFIVPFTYIRLRLGGFTKTLEGARSSDTAGSGLSGEDELTLAKQTAYAMAVAVKFGFWKPNCLTRSLALGWFLGRQRIPFEIRIGVPGGKENRDQKISGQTNHSEPSVPAPAFTAHAWIESSGVVLNDKQDIADEFSPFESGLDRHP